MIMKKNIFLSIYSVIVFSVIFSACSKDIPLQTERQVHNPTGSVTNVPPGNNGVKLYGTITGTINPAGIKAHLAAFNASYVSPEYYPDEKTGKFKIENLPEGGYNLRIMYILPSAANYSTLTIWRINVTGNNVTEIGTINLN
jgi:hypothetical protein